ncbi:MAG: YqeG family HAD IIIA-type phosphatase [Firmicutes bacterium]|nr:YqeG family HAD IIIA-type phosphatase [Bacillota bacterium]
MYSLLYPDMFISSLFHLEPQILLQRGIKHILFDLDNTIVPRDKPNIEQAVEDWLKKLCNLGFSIAIVSNNGPERVNSLAGPLHIPTVTRAVKPMKRAFKNGLTLLDGKPENTAILGDQIFTDILGGNRLGLFTILVVPLEGKEFWATSLLNRRLEKMVVKKIERRTAGKAGCFLLK